MRKSGTVPNDPLFFFDSSAVVKFYDPAEAGHSMVKHITETFRGNCFVSELSIPEVSRAIIKKRNNLPDKTSNKAKKQRIKNEAADNVKLWINSLNYDILIDPELDWNVVGASVEQRIGERAHQLLTKYDQHNDVSTVSWNLQDASDAWILATALYLHEDQGSPVVFISADVKMRLNDAARGEGLEVINPDIDTFSFAKEGSGSVAP